MNPTLMLGGQSVAAECRVCCISAHAVILHNHCMRTDAAPLLQTACTQGSSSTWQRHGPNKKKICHIRTLEDVSFIMSERGGGAFEPPTTRTWLSRAAPALAGAVSGVVRTQCLVSL
jgi:hypothetical protein